jgi:ATP-dependent helicase/nuclease subunit A
VVLAPGRLTLVGDPKQSIYRFRRADISVYEAVRAIVMKGPYLRVPLTANFRTEPRLIAHFNERFDTLLGTAAPGTDGFDAATGTVANQRLDAGRDGTREGCVAVLPFAAAEAKADAERDVEAEVLATWLRAQVDGGKLMVVDPVTESPRPVRFGDVAILAHSTYSVGKVIDELDRLDVPWSARGGTLFLDDPLHRQFLLALRALADRDDGVAQAALLRAPFFSIDLRDLVRARAAGDAPGDEGVERARAALSLVSELRKDRLARPPGATARDLLERTGLARSVAFGSNGLQRLDRLHELCFELERLAATEGLDYDGATARLREWALEAISLDPPRPVGGDAIQLMTIHQAKGLEFPVVAWWDSNAKLEPRDRTVPWFVSHTGEAWSISLDGLEWAEPEGDDVLARERSFLAAERRRLIYVAATRARDLLVLPVAGALDEAFVADALVGDPKSPAVYLEDAWGPGVVPAWAKDVEPPRARAPRTVKKLEIELKAAWAEAAAESARPRSSPVGVSTEAHRVTEEASDEAGASWKNRPSRFGPVFGDTVHRAIGLALAEPALGADGAVARAVLITGLTDKRAEAVADVSRALESLEREGLRRPPGGDLRLEYPVAAAGKGTLLLGYLDLLAVRGEEIIVLDFKTDAAPTGDVQVTHPDYVAQVRAYERILVDLGVAKAGKVKGCLLFTADGIARWV